MVFILIFGRTDRQSHRQSVVQYMNDRLTRSSGGRVCKFAGVGGNDVNATSTALRVCHQLPGLLQSVVVPRSRVQPQS